MSNTKLRCFFILFFLILLSPLLAQAGADTGILRETLANGLRVMIVRNTLAPVVTTQINYLVGSDECTRWIPWNGTRSGAHDVQRESGFILIPAFKYYSFHGGRF